MAIPGIILANTFFRLLLQEVRSYNKAKGLRVNVYLAWAASGTSRPNAAIKGKHCSFNCLGQRALQAELLIRKNEPPDR